MQFEFDVLYGDDAFALSLALLVDFDVRAGGGSDRVDVSTRAADHSGYRVRRDRYFLAAVD